MKKLTPAITCLLLVSFTAVAIGRNPINATTDFQLATPATVGNEQYDSSGVLLKGGFEFTFDNNRSRTEVALVQLTWRNSEGTPQANAQGANGKWEFVTVPANTSRVFLLDDASTSNEFLEHIFLTADANWLAPGMSDDSANDLIIWSKR